MRSSCKLLAASAVLLGAQTAAAASTFGFPILHRREDDVVGHFGRVGIVRSTGSNLCASVDTPIAPSEDPWYTAPFEFEREKPGTILRVRPAPGNLTVITGTNASAAYNILYRTTNSRYRPAWAVTTLFVPANATNSTGPALLSYQIPYDSVFVDASPSYSMYAGVDSDISDALGRGWFVNVPDYEGPEASFTAGVLAGHATLDSLRAVLSGGLRRFGIAIDPANTTTALWGYSGGALASEWASELQVQYAPELNISGAALGGLTPNVSSVLYTIYDGVEAGLAPPAILGITNEYPDIQAYILSRLKTDGPYNSTTFLNVRNQTLSESVATFAGKNISQFFEGGLADVVNNVTDTALFRDGIMGYHGVPQFPLLVYKAADDEISPVQDTDTLVDRYCAVGVNIRYTRNSVGGHVAESTNGGPAAVAWLDTLRDGTYADFYPTYGCTIQDVSVNISSTTL